MPWSEVSIMGLRLEFVRLAGQEGANLSALCRRFGISRPTGYKWLRRARVEPAELGERSRRPRHSPSRTDAAVEAEVVALRDAHPCWGGRKLARRLRDRGGAAVPSPSTITTILRRHGRLEPGESAKHTAFVRFEHAAPNALWQMDFKGHFACGGGRCHPLTVLDDHARFALCLAACADQRGATVRTRLVATFERYGLPARIVVDNGSPWGDGPGSPYTPLTVWLLRLGIGVGHSRPYHPQTLGKDERFHRTLKAEVVQGRAFADLAQCQAAFDRWRDLYNLERPHAALDLAVPASRYQPSPRPYPPQLPPLTYGPDDQVRRVQQGGWISFRGRAVRLPRGFAGQPVALRPTTRDGVWQVVFATQQIAELDLRASTGQVQPVNHVPEHVSAISPV
jgi:transposase InsO family protein